MYSVIALFIRFAVFFFCYFLVFHYVYTNMFFVTSSGFVSRVAYDENALFFFIIIATFLNCYVSLKNRQFFEQNWVYK